MDWTFFVSLLFVGIWVGLPVMAGFIAHRKGRSWLAAVLVSVVAPPLGIALASFQRPKPGTGPHASLRAKLLLGLLPLWASLAIVAAGGVAPSSAGYWQGAPWLIVIAVPACALTLALVELLALWRNG